MNQKYSYLISDKFFPITLYKYSNVDALNIYAYYIILNSPGRTSVEFLYGIIDETYGHDDD